MTKMRAGELPNNMKNKGVVEVKSTKEMTKEVTETSTKKSLIESIKDKECKGVETTKTETKDIAKAKAFMKILEKENKKQTKERTMIYLEEHTMKQFKTLARAEGVSVAKLFEIACKNFIKGQEVDDELVAEYDNINKAKGRRKK